MNKTNSNFVKMQTKNQKALNADQTKTEKAIEVATKFEQVAALVSQVGQTVNLAGKGLVALGASMSWAAGAGAALIAAGNVMQKVLKQQHTQQTEIYLAHYKVQQVLFKQVRQLLKQQKD